MADLQSAVTALKPAVPPRAWAWLAFLGLFFTARGYRSLEGDQAYRLPLWLRHGRPELYADDPFVTAFDAFNPHRGYLGLLDLAAWPCGLSAALLGLFLASLVLTASALNRLGKAAWPCRDAGPVVAALALLCATAGNLGTNHLFEPMLLDRLLAFGLGWWAIALAVEAPWKGARTAAPLVGLAALVHPSVGLQLAMLLAAGGLAWWATRRAAAPDAWRFLAALGLAVLPGLALNLGQPGRLLAGLSPDDFWLLSVELQSPQHMLPHLWRPSQWLAWCCYPALAALSVFAQLASSRSAPRSRLALLLAVNLVGLGVAWVGIELYRHLRLTVFQPFRMATVARGLCLVFLAGHWLGLWRTGGLARVRALLLAAGLTGDKALVVVTAFEALMALSDRLRISTPGGRRRADLTRGTAWAALAAGGLHLSRHDTASGHLALLAALAGAAALEVYRRFRPWTWDRPRMLRVTLACWLLPATALAAQLAPEAFPPALRDFLARRCRFVAVPLDDTERLAVWCRDHMPPGARFVGPPGAKSFRLWSQRALAFNRAAGPYHAAGLADWAARFIDHVGFEGDRHAFVAAYLRDRRGLEAGYDRMGPAQLAALAERQGASYVLASSALAIGPDGPLQRVRTQGKLAVYRIGPRTVQQAEATHKSRR